MEFITATESAIKHNKLDQASAEELRTKVTACLNNAKVPNSNLNKEEREAVKTLGKDNNITILPADKGRCTVVLDKIDYDEKVSALLNDTNTYELLKWDPSSGYRKKVIDSLQELERSEVIDRDLYHKLYPGETVPKFYGLPKIHKENSPLRPIVSSVDSVTYNVAKHLGYIIGLLVGKSEHHIKNSQDFVNKIKDISIEEGETITSYDVSALFTCVPPDEAVNVVREFLLNDTALNERTKLSPDQVCSLLELCLNTTYFVYNGRFYRQRHGCAMGSPVSSIVVNLFMEHFERQALDSYTGTPPTHWYRYVDDTWVKIKVDQLVPFFDHINNVNQYIKFTQEELKDGKLAFLDCSVSIVEDGKLRTSVYRKSTHTDQYLLFESHHPLVHKLGVIRTLFHRADTICLDEDLKDSEHKHLKSALGACGYQSWTFEKALKKSKPRTFDSNSNRTQGGESRRYNTTIPYVSKLSEKIRRIYREYQLPVSFKPYNTLRQKLVHPKDKTPKDKQNNIVYGFRCQDNGCEETYIGETKQTLGKRMYQHRRASTSGCGDSAVYSHLNSANHSFDNRDVIILDRESRWFERGVKEALYVKCEQPSLNKGGGLRHNLAGAYSSAITKIPQRLKSLSTPSTGQ